LTVLDDVDQRVCVDPARIYASGASDGEDMVTRLACEAGDRFAAMRPYIGMNYPEIFESEGCDQSVPVPMTSYVGTDEPYYDLVGDIEAGLAMWAERNGCKGEPITEDVTDGVTVTRYADCDQDAIVELYTLDGVEHEAAQVECEGNDPGFCVTYPFDTTGTMLEFFAQYSR
jgi:polyhydroxybutyrate depolymerase